MGVVGARGKPAGARPGKDEGTASLSAWYPLAASGLIGVTSLPPPPCLLDSHAWRP